jgi:hypothetical protein
VRLNATQRAVLEGVDIDGRRFAQCDILLANADGSESCTRLMISGAKLEEFIGALAVCADESAIANIGRSYV